jgi:hypothetical protein
LRVTSVELRMAIGRRRKTRIWSSPWTCTPSPVHTEALLGIARRPPGDTFPGCSGRTSGRTWGGTFGRTSGRTFPGTSGRTSGPVFPGIRGTASGSAFPGTWGRTSGPRFPGVWGSASGPAFPGTSGRASGPAFSPTSGRSFSPASGSTFSPASPACSGRTSGRHRYAARQIDQKSETRELRAERRRMLECGCALVLRCADQEPGTKAIPNCQFLMTNGESALVFKWSSGQVLGPRTRN